MCCIMLYCLTIDISHHLHIDIGFVFTNNSSLNDDQMTNTFPSITQDFRNLIIEKQELAKDKSCPLSICCADVDVKMDNIWIQLLSPKAMAKLLTKQTKTILVGVIIGG